MPSTPIRPNSGSAISVFSLADERERVAARDDRVGPEPSDRKRFLVNWRDEIDSAALYRALAELSPTRGSPMSTAAWRRPRSGMPASGKASCGPRARGCRSGGPVGERAC